jgi:arylsulfatase
MMKKLISLIVTSLQAYIPAMSNSPEVESAHKEVDERSRPNIIIVLSDDQGYGDFSSHGNPILKTPALDKLRNEAIRFENFHVAPLSTPTRGQLLTGLDALRNGAATVLTGRNLLKRDITTLPEILRENGYRTGIFGKWHLGDNYPDRPMDRGFQKCIWHLGWGLLSEAEFDNDYYETQYLDSLKRVQSGEYCTNLWFNKAIEWMGEMAQDKRPFFSFISLNSPHGPFLSPAQDFNFYKDLVADSSAASFFGMIRNIDRNVSRLDRWLEEEGLKENTIVIYMTDNGGTAGVDVFNAGMRDKKGSIYEGGHRAACFIRWPGGDFIAPVSVALPTQIQDLLPTFIDVLNLKTEIKYRLDGVSLEPILRRGQILKNRMFVVQYGGNIKPKKYDGCVVWDSWRLIGRDELYDLKNDPGQKRDISGEFPEVVSKMRNFYEEWWIGKEQEIDDIIPIIVGSDLENPVIFNSNNWVDGAVNTQWNVALARGSQRGGTTHIRISTNGVYKVELSRWPFHLNRSLSKNGPATSVGGSQIRAGRALPVKFGCISLNGGKEIISQSEEGATSISFEFELQKGDKTVQAWFRDIDGNDLCGAYYIRVERVLNNNK